MSPLVIALVLALAFFVALSVGLTAGILARLDGATWPRTINTFAVALGATLSLFCLIWSTCRG